MGNKFSKSFDRYVCTGDSIVAEVDGFTVTARIEYDDTGRTPEQMSEGFWPSKDPKSPGYVLAENYEREMAKAQKAMDAWKNDQWFYCGVVLSVSKKGIVLDDMAASLWGIECNYPDSDNSYLAEVANELLPEALKVGKKLIAELCEGVSA